MGPTARPFIFKCLLNNVGLVKAQSSFFLALSRYVFIIKHVSVSTRLLPAFVKDFIKPAVLVAAALCCRHVVWEETTSQRYRRAKRQNFLFFILYLPIFKMYPIPMLGNCEPKHSGFTKNILYFSGDQYFDNWRWRHCCLKLIHRMDYIVNMSRLNSPLEQWRFWR